MLRFGGFLISDTLKELSDITRHRDVEVAFLVVSIKIDSAVEVSLPVFGKLIVLLQGLE